MLNTSCSVSSFFTKQVKVKNIKDKGYYASLIGEIVGLPEHDIESLTNLNKKALIKILETVKSKQQ
jgi:hypothetical protein